MEKSESDKIVGWHRRCNGHELGKTSGDGEGQGGKESDMTGRLNNNNHLY